MTVTFGPAEWWITTNDAIDGLAISCPEGTILPDGSALICKAGGTAWIVAPVSTQVSEPWGNYTACGNIDNFLAGVSVHPEITSTNFPVLYNQLISCGFSPGDWFVPCIELLENPGYVCRTNWDSFDTTCYWSSTEICAERACASAFGTGGPRPCFKTGNQRVRAFRCVTY
jgi:hypothetical protein